MVYEGDAENDCPFCTFLADRHVVETHGMVAALYDNYPVTEGHLLVIPIRHVRDYFSMSAKERTDADRLIEILRDRTLMDDPSVTGFNIGTNIGASAGQTVFHAHIHLIPRRDGDCEEPRGGVRGVIDGKRCY